MRIVYHFVYRTPQTVGNRDQKITEETTDDWRRLGELFNRPLDVLGVYVTTTPNVGETPDRGEKLKTLKRYLDSVK